MSLVESALPDDVVLLKAMLLESEARRDVLEEENRLLRAHLFGRRSEKAPSTEEPLQLTLFDEPAPPPPAKRDEQPPIKVGAHDRRRGRRRLPAQLERVEVIHDVAEGDKICPCGAVKGRIGQETAEQLEIVPARLRVICNVRPKYACRECENTWWADEEIAARVTGEKPTDESVEAAMKRSKTVTIAPPPPQLIPKSIASAGLLAHIVTAKVVDSIPLYRQEAQFARMGVDLGRATMSGWLIRIGEALARVMVALRHEIRSGPLINADETRIQVLDEPGRAATTDSFMWVFRGGSVAQPAVEFLYDPSRGAEVARKYLDGYCGRVQTDGYVGYAFLDATPGIVHAGCWAHVRRKFIDVTKAVRRGSSTKSGGVAQEAVDRIAELYGFERMVASMNVSIERLVELRQEQAKPMVDDFHKWLQHWSPNVPPKSLLGKAIAYALDQWPRLVVYLADGLLRLDNNLAENSLRPFVVGRKNWLFAATPAGAVASARLYSIVETAKASGLDPYWYLRALFDQLPRIQDPEKFEYRKLLPQFIDRQLLVPIT